MSIVKEDRLKLAFDDILASINVSQKDVQQWRWGVYFESDKIKVYREVEDMVTLETKRVDVTSVFIQDIINFFLKFNEIIDFLNSQQVK